jgi:hypothetical protein
MPLGSYIGSLPDERPSTKKTVIWRGIDQTYDESKYAIDAKEGCFTPKSVNTVISGGNITVRNNYEAITSTTVTQDLNDGYTYIIRKLWCYTSTAAGASRLLALAEAQSGGVFHHYCLLARKMDLSDPWAEVKSAATHALGAPGDSIWFSNGDMSFANYSGDFMENGTTVLATMLANGSDLQAFYRPETGLHVLGASAGWKNVTVNPTTNTLTATGLVTSNGETLELYSRTQQMPGGASPFRIYYAVNVSGNNFQISLTDGGSAIDLTSAGANVIGRLNKDYGYWAPISVVQSTSTFNGGGLATNGLRVMFSAPSGALPRGISATASYYVVNASGTSWQVSLSEAGEPITISSAGSNVKARTVTKYPNDPPRGKDITIHEDRAWAFSGDTLYHNAGFYDNPNTDAWDGLAHPNDWYTAVLAGNIPKPTWDGDTLVALRSIGGRMWAFKRNSLFEVTGNKPPFGIREVQNATGTIAPDSICEHPLYGIFWATPTGIVRFNGSNTEPYLVDAISRIWSADNEDCVAVVKGDMLIVHGNFLHPETGVKGKAILSVDLATRNVNYWTLDLGGVTLGVTAVLDPRFTTVEDKSKVPEFWFVADGKIYRYSLTEPAAGQAVAMTYWEPQTDYGDSMRKKRVSKIKIDGSGGTLTITPYQDGTAKTAKTFELPRKQPIAVSCNGYTNGFKYSSANDPVVIKSIEREYA